METNKVLNLTFASSLTDLCEINSSFDKAVLRIAYKDLNRNKSFISKETFNRCAKTMYNCPVVCNYNRETDSIGGHDTEVFRDNDGSIRIVNVTTPVGTVPSQSKYWWDVVEEDDGTLHEYLFTEVLIWKRQEAYAKIKRDNITAHSMEITIKDGELKDGIFYIYDFEFTAFCLIGVEPCFESSALSFSIVNTENDFQLKFSEMMHELKETITQVTTSNDVDNTHPQKYSMEGGNEVLNEKLELAAEYSIDVDSLDFDINEFTIDELTEKFQAITNKVQDVEEKVEVDSMAEEENDESFNLASNTMEELQRTLSENKVEREWGTSCKYCYVDADFENHEVYCFDTEDWLLYGFEYSVNGDALSIDYESKKRKKFAITDFEGEQESPVAQMFASMEQTIKENIGWEAKYNTASETIASLDKELSELRQYKLDVETAIENSKREELFAKFEDLVGIDAFESLREDNSQYDFDTLEEKLFALRGRNGVPAKFNLNEHTPKFKVDKTDMSKIPYGGIVEKYLGLDE